MAGAGDTRRTAAREPTAAPRPGALTELLADLARAPEGAGWEVPLQVGEQVGRFQIVREIGRGGFGVVYEARDNELSRLVAFKAVRAGTAASGARAIAEAEAAARLAHPNIVHLYDLGHSDRGAWLIMELLHGCSLAGRFAEGSLPLRQAVWVAVEISRGLAHAHAQGVIHRDLKPSNVFLCDDGQVKVLDFGLAQVFGKAGVAGGTPAYMAPEQAAGAPGDERSDVYSLGKVVRELVPQGTKGAPAALTKLVERMTAQDPAGRPASGADVLSALLPIQESLEPKKLLWASATVVVMAIGSALAFAFFWQRPPPPGRLVTAIADTDNRSGDPDLDGVSELLRIGLGQTRRLSLMGRAQLVKLLRDAGAPLEPAIDEPRARQAAARGQAQLLLVPAVRQDGQGFTVSLRALDLLRSEPLFAISERMMAKGAFREVADRLVREARRRLREEPGDVASYIPTTELAPASPEAWAKHAEGERLAWLGGAEAEDTAEDAWRAAIKLDPGFPQPRMSLLFWDLMGGADVREPRRHLEALSRSMDRIPPRERPFAEFLAVAYDDGSDPQALLAAADRAIAAWPEDPRPYLIAEATIAREYADREARHHYLEKVVTLAALPPNLAVQILMDLGRLDEALALRWSEEHPDAASLRFLGFVRTARGETAEALAAARRAVALMGAWEEKGHLDLSVDAPEYLEADDPEAYEAEVADGERSSPPWQALCGRGRLALQAWRALAPPPGAPDPQLGRHAWRGARVLFARGDAKALVEAAEAMFRHPFDQPPWVLAWPLAALGHLEEADRLAQTAAFVPGRQLVLRTYRLISQWKKGDPAGALRGFEQLETCSARLYQGEILAELGRHREAVEALRLVRRCRFMPGDQDMTVRPMLHPRSLYLEAVSLEQLGERDEARQVIGRLLHLWDQADPDFPLVAEARALGRRLGVASERRGP